MSDVVIRPADEVSDALVSAIAGLLPQLSSTAAPPNEEQLSEVVGTAGSVLLLAETPAGELAGMLTLVTYRVPTGVHAVIEDVVVDETKRGRGIGSALVTEALSQAKARGARNVDLTSRPSRGEANRLYTGLGFLRRDTNVYRYSLGEG